MVIENFKVNDLYLIKKDHFYSDKLLRVVAVDKIGVVFENEYEVESNRLSTKIKYYFGLPPLEAFWDAGMFERLG